MSHSSFKEFADSPRAFIRYKTGQKKVTQAMVEGTLNHAMLLEPDTVKDKFFVEPDVNRAKNEGRLKLIDFYINIAYTTGIDKDIIREGEIMPQENQKEIILKQSFFADLVQKSVVTQQAIDFASAMVDEMNRNDAAGWLLSQTDKNETHAKWSAFGYNWQGYIDSMGSDIIFDLKKVQDANPRKLRYTIRDLRIDWQAAHYTNGAGNENKEYYILAFDGNLDITVMHIHKEIIDQAWDEIARTMTAFKKCSFLNGWDASYDFHSPDGFYEY